MVTRYEYVLGTIDGARSSYTICRGVFVRVSDSRSYANIATNFKLANDAVTHPNEWYATGSKQCGRKYGAVV